MKAWFGLRDHGRLSQGRYGLSTEHESRERCQLTNEQEIASSVSGGLSSVVILYGIW